MKKRSINGFLTFCRKRFINSEKKRCRIKRFREARPYAWNTELPKETAQ